LYVTSGLPLCLGQNKIPATVLICLKILQIANHSNVTKVHRTGSKVNRASVLYVEGAFVTVLSM